MSSLPPTAPQSTIAATSGSSPAAPVGSAESAGAFLTIDLDAIADNWRLLKSKIGTDGDCAGVVKANAYGLGSGPVGKALFDAGCRTFFVAHVDEGVLLRKSVPASASIFILHGAAPGAEEICASHALIPILNSLPQVRAWVALCGRWARRLPAGIQVDSGMARAGLDEADLETLLSTDGLLEAFEPRLIMSHLACADEPESLRNREQLKRFSAMRAKLPGIPASFANSSGVFLGSDWHFDLLRPGAALYGINPTPGKPNPMKPVVRLRGKLMQSRTVPANTPVGYGGTYVTTGTTRLATVSVGYADGFFRSLGNVANAVCGDYALPIVGRVSMDMIIIDVTSMPEDLLYPGALFELIGPQRTVDTLADEAGTIGYEILTNIGNRYHRTYLSGGSIVASSSSL